MTADKRNASVVIALILSMTVGAQVLLWLEPATPRWAGDTLLMAERGTAVQVEVFYAGPEDDVVALKDAAADAGDSLCVIDPSGVVERWEPRGSRVQLVVIGSEADTLSKRQKETLLAALGTLCQDGDSDRVRVQLAAEANALESPAVPPQAADLRNLLERRGIIE